MQLSWSDQAGIAASLLETYPEADRLALSRDQLLHMILTLPGFNDKNIPPQPACLDHIRWTWMRLADGAPEEKERRRI